MVKRKKKNRQRKKKKHLEKFNSELRGFSQNFYKISFEHGIFHLSEFRCGMVSSHSYVGFILSLCLKQKKGVGERECKERKKMNE